jgi:hypothetical protein
MVFSWYLTSNQYIIFIIEIQNLCQGQIYMCRMKRLTLSIFRHYIAYSPPIL